MRTILLFTLSACAAAQIMPRDRITFSGGWSGQVGGHPFARKDRGTGLGLSLGHRIRHWVEAEAGIFTALQPAPEMTGKSFFLDPDDRFLWVPFGVRFIAPLYLDRIEFSGGGGGLYEQYSVSNPAPLAGVEPRSGWGGYVVASTAVPIDRGRHFWLGVTPRLFLANPSGRRDRWLQITGEFSFRF